jgi:hypothetical protein
MLELILVVVHASSPIVQPPEVGDRVDLAGDLFDIIEVQELIPSMGGFSYLHCTCRWVSEEA